MNIVVHVLKEEREKDINRNKKLPGIIRITEKMYDFNSEVYLLRCLLPLQLSGDIFPRHLQDCFRPEVSYHCCFSGQIIMNHSNKGQSYLTKEGERRRKKRHLLCNFI